jgi:hypothetical protein
VTGKIAKYLYFFFAKRYLGNDFQTRRLVRLWILQVFGFEDVFVFLAVMTWSVGGMRMVGLCRRIDASTCRPKRAVKERVASEPYHLG